MGETERWGAAWGLARELARARSEGQVAGVIARAAGARVHAESVRVWAFDREKGYRFSGSWPTVSTPPERPSGDVARAVVFEAPIAAKAVAPFRSCLVIPLHAGPRPLGAVEILESNRAEGPLTPSDAAAMSDLIAAADAALEALQEGSLRQSGYVAAIARLTRLYDIGRSLTSTLEMDPLVKAVVNRVQAALDVHNAYLWLLDEGTGHVSIAAAAGSASEAVEGWELEPGQGVAGHVAATGEGALYLHPDEIPDHAARPDIEAGLAIAELAAVPVVSAEDRLMGVIEVVVSDGEATLGKAEMAFLRQIAETTALAIGNARRLDAERRASDLGALLAAAQELGSSLDIQKVAFTLVHQAASVLRYRQAAVGLVHRAGLDLQAVSGGTFVDETLPEMKALRDLLAWAASLPSGLYVVQEEDGTIEAEREETREKFHAYFEKTGSRSFLTVPLEDEEGRIGVFSLESGEPYAFAQRDLEAAGLLATLAAIAMRNAMLYQQIPMMRVLQPFARVRRLFARGARRRAAVWAGAVGAAAVLLFAVPIPRRVAGDARVLPARRVPVTAEVEGRVAHVMVREGSEVAPGQAVALLDDAEYRMGLDDAAARHQVMVREQSRFRADGRLADAAVADARLKGLEAEVELWRSRLERTRISPRIAGVIATPRIEERLGARLARGDVFCEVVDPSLQSVEVAVAEADVGLVAEGMAVKVKLQAFPARSFPARVAQVAVVASDHDQGRVFLVRARLLGAPPLRTGMTGWAKISTGRAGIAPVLLRRPARWVWRIVWGWLP